MDPTYSLAFMAGLAGGFGHCIGMCGPVVGAYALRDPARSLRGRVLSQLLYHGGRIATYGAVGALMGLAGSFVNLAGAPASGLPSGDINSLVGHPAAPNRFFAASHSQGIYRSDDTGATWTRVANGITNSASGCGTNTQRVLLGLHNKAGVEAVYAAVLNAPSYTPHNPWR